MQVRREDGRPFTLIELSEPQLLLHLVFQLCIFVYSILQIPQISSALGSLPSDACGLFEVRRSSTVHIGCYCHDLH